MLVGATERTPEYAHMTRPPRPKTTSNDLQAERWRLMSWWWCSRPRLSAARRSKSEKGQWNVAVRVQPVAQRTGFGRRAVAVALVVGVEHDHDIEHGHHDAPVDKDGAHVGEGPPRRPEQAEQAGGYQHDGVVDQGHGSLATG